MSLADLTSLRNEMEKCFRCSLCKMVPLPTVKNPAFTDACPAARYGAFHGYSTSGKQIMALAVLDGRVQPDAKMAEVTFACTACGYGDVACKFIMDAERHAVNMALREHLVESGFALPAHKKLIENLEQSKHPRGADRQRYAWWDGLPLKKMPDEQAEVLLLAGCDGTADAATAKSAHRLAQLLVHAGLSVGTLADNEACCGLPAYWTGHKETFKAIGKDNVETLSRSKATTIVALSGSCLGAYRSKIPEALGHDVPTVLHATEFLWKLIDEGRLKLTRKVSGRVTYHDPCYLGRQSEPPVRWEGEVKVAQGCMTYFDPPKPINRGTQGVYDPPRNILKAVQGLDFVEMHRIREYAFCCGGGGGVPEAYPDMALSTAKHRLDEAKDVGAERVVTACGHCRTNLGRAEAMPIVDIVDLVFEAAGLADQGGAQ